MKHQYKCQRLKEGGNEKELVKNTAKKSISFSMFGLLGVEEF